MISLVLPFELSCSLILIWWGLLIVAEGRCDLLVAYMYISVLGSGITRCRNLLLIRVLIGRHSGKYKNVTCVMEKKIIPGFNCRIWMHRTIIMTTSYYFQRWNCCLTPTVNQSIILYKKMCSWKHHVLIWQNFYMSQAENYLIISLRYKQLNTFEIYL